MKYFTKLSICCLFFISCDTTETRIIDTEWMYFSAPPEPLSLRLEVKNDSDDYFLETLLLKLNLENSADDTITIWGPTSDKFTIDFIVLDEQNTLLWKKHTGVQSLGGKFFEFGPGEELVRTERWFYQDFNNNKLKPGNYRIFGVTEARPYSEPGSLNGESYYVSEPYHFEVK